MHIFNITPPIESASNQMAPRKEPSDMIIEQIPGADFSLNNVPNNNPNPINIIEEGISAMSDISIPPIFKPTSVIKEIINEAI